MNNTTRKKAELEASGAKLPRFAVERKIKNKIIPWLKREEIIVITGARQTGKSVLLYQLIFNYLFAKTSNIFYFNLDIPGRLKFFDNPGNIVNLVKKTKKTSYIFIDEIQRLKEPGLFLKGLYDLHLPLKFIVSGSSTLEIKSKVQEALTGRKIVFHLNSFDLEELSWALFPKKSFRNILSSEQERARLLNHFSSYGGYPAVSLAKEEKTKQALLKEIFQSYLEKDVASFLKVENITAFRNLVKILASQTGNIMNKDELSNTLGIHKLTLDHYLFYLEQTFIVDFIRPFFKNVRKELLKSPKIYFQDLGLRNFAISSFGDFDFRPDKGTLFENLCCLCLKGKIDSSITPIHYWRTKTGAEVDFVIPKGLKPLPIEIKATALKDFKITKSLRSFVAAYQPEKAYCVNLALKGKQRLGNTEVIFLDLIGFLDLNFEALS